VEGLDENGENKRKKEREAAAAVPCAFFLLGPLLRFSLFFFSSLFFPLALPPALLEQK